MHHPATVEIGGAEMDGLRDAQPGGVAGGQDRAVLEGRDAREEADDYLGAEHDREPSRLLWSRVHGVDGQGFCRVTV